MISRKDFLLKAAGVMGLAVVSPVLLESCGSKTPPTDACTPQNLSEEEQGKRKGLQYVGKSPEAGKNCANCKIYKKPAKKGDCGGCELFEGPVHPDGYCISWLAIV